MKNITAFLRLSVVLIVTMIVSGCNSITTVTPSLHSDTPQTEKTFNENYYLCEVRTLSSTWGEAIYVARELSPCSPWERVRLPSFAAYQQDSASWKNWRLNVASQYRIVGIVDTNTHYHVTKMITTPKTHIQYITIDNGPLAGTKAEIHG